MSARLKRGEEEMKRVGVADRVVVEEPEIIRLEILEDEVDAEVDASGEPHIFGKIQGVYFLLAAKLGQFIARRK